MQNAIEVDLRGAVAYSYARFSDPSQSAGHSLERQQEYAPQFCKEFGCKLDTTLSFTDQGKSAFHGRHIADGGGLSRFKACIEAGRVKSGDILIVENLDRVSRLPLEQAEELLKSILIRGVQIHTRSPWAIYDRATLNDPMQRMQMIFEFTRSHRESKYKQERLTRRWIANRENIVKKEYYLSRIPSWIEPRRQGNKVVGYNLIPERCAVIRKIFALCIDGHGLNVIAKTLNSEKVPTWGKSKSWARSTVARILSTRTVLGEYQPFSSVKTEGREIKSVERAAIGPVVKDHFPRVINDDVYNKAQKALDNRNLKLGTISSSNTGKVTNLFSGLIRDARSGDSMHVIDKGYGLQLVQKGAVTGATKSAYVPYKIIEQAFITYVDQMPLDLVMPRDTQSLDTKIKLARKEVQSLELQVAKIKDKARTSVSDALLELLVERDGELKRKQQEIETLERQKGSAATVAANTSKELLQLMSKAQGDELNELRRKLRNEIRYWVKQVTILPLKFHDIKAAMVDVETSTGQHLEFRVSDEDIEWPEELDGLNILEFKKWPKAIQRVQWDALTITDKWLLDLNKQGKQISEIAAETGLAVSVVSRHLIALGQRRSNRTTLNGDRLMSWNSSANGWQRAYKGKRYYVGCGTLKELYPKLVKSMDQDGTLKAANKWWKDNHAQ